MVREHYHHIRTPYIQFSRTKINNTWIKCDFSYLMVSSSVISHQCVKFWVCITPTHRNIEKTTFYNPILSTVYLDTMAYKSNIHDLGNHTLQKCHIEVYPYSSQLESTTKRLFISCYAKAKTRSIPRSLNPYFSHFRISNSSAIGRHKENRIEFWLWEHNIFYVNYLKFAIIV